MVARNAQVSRSLGQQSLELQALQDVGHSWRGAAEIVGIDPSLLSRQLRGERPLNPENEATLQRLLNG